MESGVIGREKSVGVESNEHIDALLVKIFDGKPSEEELKMGRRRFVEVVDLLLKDSMRGVMADRYTCLIGGSKHGRLMGVVDNQDNRMLNELEVSKLNAEMEKKFFDKRSEIISML